MYLFDLEYLDAKDNVNITNCNNFTKLKILDINGICSVKIEYIFKCINIEELSVSSLTQHQK